MALGQPASFECLGQPSRGESLTRFYLKPEYRFTVQAYSYPGDSGYPVLQLDQVELEDDGNCYFCEFSNLLPPVTSAYESAMLTIYGEHRSGALGGGGRGGIY